MKPTYLINLSDKRILENSGDRIPMGIYSIAGNNPNCEVYDLNHIKESDLLDKIKSEKPDVGISVYTSAVYPEAIDLATKLKNIGVKTIAGGYHATAMPETLLPYFDSVVIGEGEKLLEISKQENGIITGELPRLKELNNPAYMDMSMYNMQQSGKRTATIISSRGCFGSCSFCGKLSNKVRYEPSNKILNQIAYLKGQKFEAFYFVDDIFTQNLNRMKKICEGLDVPYRVTTRADLIDKDKLEILADTGCDWISLGIESGNDMILKKSNKGMTTYSNFKAVKNAADKGINVKGFFILGLPGETEQTANDTINFARALKEYGLTSADFYFLSPFPGTPIWKNPESFGIKIKDKDFTKYLQAGKTARCYIDTEELKSEHIEELVNEAKETWKS